MMRISAAAIAVSALFALVVLPRATWPLVDPDVWWHIRAGQAALAGEVPRVDTWSLTAAGRAWTSQDWLANAIMAGAFESGPWGVTVLSLLFAAITMGAFVLLWSAVGRRAPAVGWLSRVTWLAAGLLLAGPTLGVRVQVIDLLFAAAALWLLWNLMATRSAAWILGLPVVAVAWVNLHAGWPLLFLIGGATLCGEVADLALRRHVAGRSPLGPRALGALALALLASASVLVINPNGIDIYRYPLDTLALDTLKAAVGEWQPARLDNIFGWLLLTFIVVGVVPALVFGRAQMRTADALVLLGLSALAVVAIRFLLVLGPIGAAIIAVTLAPAISASRVGQAAAPMLRRLGTPRTGALGLANGAIAALLVAAGLALSILRVDPGTQEREIAAEQPVAAVAWVNANDPGQRVFNRYEWGGYLGLRRPDLPIYIDGRADVYGDEIIAEYVRTIGLSVDPQATFDRYDIDHILFPPDTPLAGWLDHSDAWRRVYGDPIAAVWVRE